MKRSPEKAAKSVRKTVAASRVKRVAGYDVTRQPVPARKS